MPSREIKLRDLLIIYSTFNFQSKFLSSQCLIIRDENKVWYKKKFITGLGIDTILRYCRRKYSLLQSFDPLEL